MTAEHKLTVRAYLADLAQKAKLRDPQSLAAQLALLIDGAWITARLFRNGDNPAMNVLPAAKALIDARRRVPSGEAVKKRR
jgi:hypothetical protein